MFAAADQIMGWSGWWGSLLSLCARGVFMRVTGGLQRARVVARRGGVGSYDLKETFL